MQQVLLVMPGAGNRQRRYHHYLKGLLWCERCSRRIIVMRGKSKTGAFYFDYVCRGRQDKLCDLPYIRAASMETAVADHYRTVILPMALRQQLSQMFDAAAAERGGQDAKTRAALRKRLTELDLQEDRYIELALDPDWPKAKLTEKLRALRDERAKLTTTLNETVEQLDKGHQNARRVLDYLAEPHQLYERAGIRGRNKLNRVLFSKLRVDVAEPAGADKPTPFVSGDNLTEPFSAVVQPHREHYPVQAWTYQRQDQATTKSAGDGVGFNAKRGTPD